MPPIMREPAELSARTRALPEVRESLVAMWLIRRRGKDERNVLLDAALEFGKNWRRDVQSLAGERLAGLDELQRATLGREIEEVRSTIEQWILDRWEAAGGSWSKSDAQAARVFIQATYPWMGERNVAHTISQGTYYAWHG